MKRLFFTAYLLMLVALAPAQTINLHADRMRLRIYDEDRKAWQPWDTIKCDVPIIIAPQFDQITTGNALDETLNIKLSDNGRYYNAVDYEGFPVAVVLYKNTDKTYNVLFRCFKAELFYNDKLVIMYDYQYIHARPVTQKVMSSYFLNIKPINDKARVRYSNT